MNILSDVGKLQEVHISTPGFKVGNYYTVKFAAKNDECIDMDVSPDELEMTALAFLRAVVKAGRWQNIATEVTEILDGKA